MIGYLGYLLNLRFKSHVAFAAIKPVSMISHKNSGSTALGRAFLAEARDFSIPRHLIVF